MRAVPSAPRRSSVRRHVLLPALLLPALLLVPAALHATPAAQAAAPPVHFAFYITYNPNSWAALQAHVDALNYVSPWFYNVNAAGQITGTPQPFVNALLHAHGAKNLPLLKNTPGYANFHPLVADATKRAAIIAQIQALIAQNGYDGITIDFEAINPDDAGLLTAFMQELYTALHSAGKTVAMAIPSKSHDVNTGWAGAFDYRALQPWADYFVIMAYDQHYPGGGPGPIATLPWQASIAVYAGATLSPGKVIWGVGVYGYDWNLTQQPRPMADPRTWGEVQQLAQTFHGQLAFDEPSQSPSLVYTNNGQSHVVWYEDSRSFAAKLGLATQQHFAGVGLWRLGQEDPGIWAQWAGAPSPPSTPTPPPAPPTPSPTATPPPAPPSGVCSPIAPFANTPTRVYFPQTGHSLGGGFYQYWLSHGGLAVFGYPLTEEFAERSTTDGQVYTVQYFERNRFEWHPELQGTPYAIQLGLLGAQYTASHISPLTQSHIVPIPGRQFFAETNHNLGGGFLEYWQAHGALAQFGYPISEEISERSATDGQVYTVQYFQRARLEWHPEHSGTPNAIQLGLLGSWALQQRGCTP